MLHLGQVLLERGHTVRGMALLEQVTWLAPRSEAAANALFVLGRYYHRVKQEPETARHVWRELASRFPTTGWAGGAWCGSCGAVNATYATHGWLRLRIQLSVSLTVCEVM